MAATLQALFYKYIWRPEVRDVNLENPKAPLNGWTLDQVLGGGGGYGRSISQEAALTLSAFYRAVSIKSGILSSLPYKLYETTSTGRREVKPDEHPVAAMFAGRVNGKMTKTVFLERAMSQYDIKGNHYARIIRNGLGQVAELQYLRYEDVTVYETTNAVAYKIAGVMDALAASEITHVPNFGDGITGISVLQKARQDFALQMNTREYGDKFFSGGGKPIGLFIPKGNVKDTQREELQRDWRKSKGQNTDFAMPYGWEYKELSVSPSDAEFLGTSQAGIGDVARWTGVPPHKLADMGRATWNNIEHMGIEFLQDTMGPIGSKFQNEHKIKLLVLPGEADMYLEFNWDAYLKTDTLTKVESFVRSIQNAIKTPNQIRALNNDEPMPGADKLFIQSGTVPIDLLEQMILSKSGGPRQEKTKRKFTVDDLLDLLNAQNGNER